MATAFDPDKHWDRVAAELQAHREAQQRTWGDLDNATLGRYLADASGADERRQVEEALDSLPELRRLTDLVREVLAEPLPVEAPATLPFPAPAARRRPMLRRYGGLAAAAAVLLALGLSLSGWRPQERSAPEAARVASVSEVARRSSPGTEPDDLTVLALAPAVLMSQAVKERQLQHEAERLRQEGQFGAAQVVTARQVAVLNSCGAYYQAQGDLVAAQDAYRRASHACDRMQLDDRHQVTVESRRNLGKVYQLALLDGPTEAAGAGGYPGAPVYPMAKAFLGGPSAAPASVVEAKGHYLTEAKPERADTVYWLRSARDLRGRLMQQPAEAVPVLRYALTHETNSHDRCRYALALAVLGPEARDAVPDLVQQLGRSTDPGESLVLLTALHRIAPDGPGGPLTLPSASAAAAACAGYQQAVLGLRLAVGDYAER